ncbi:hypothetical protein GCM10027615_43740 [Plantactinospora veratri]
MGWLGVALIGGALVAVCLLLAHRATGAARGTLLGIASGLLYAGTASLLKTVAERVTRDPLSTLTDWHLYALAVVGFASVALNQNAFQNGPLAAPLTAITLVDPVASVVIGVTAFHETLSFGGLRLLVEVPAILAMGFGIWLASTRSIGREGFEGVDGPAGRRLAPPVVAQSPVAARGGRGSRHIGWSAGPPSGSRIGSPRARKPYRS